MAEAAAATAIVGDLNLGKVCRVCLDEVDEAEMHSVFSELTTAADNFGDSNFIYEILMSVSNMKIECNDGLPALICTTCLELAHSAFNFQQKCNRTQAVFDTYCLGKLNEGAGILIEEEFSLLLPDDGVQYDDISAGEDAGAGLGVDSKVIDERAADKGEEGKEKLHGCTLCDKSYKFKNSLRSHMKNHSEETPHVCSVCGKGFKQATSLTAHMRGHDGAQPYECKVCGKRYRQAGTLTAHMRVHTGHRPFLCSICGKGFRQAPDLNYHMRTHTKEKPYMCNICGKTMTMQCHLVMHMRTHTGERPYQCEICNKSFPSVSRLKRHAIIHTGLKPYTCKVCDKSFNRASTLKVHAKIHSDERPHSCPICGKGFLQSSTLKTHIATAHSESETL